MISREEGVGKMRAALEGRQDPALVVAGRTSAAAINGLDDAITRAKAYADAGVDAMFFVGIKTPEELKAIGSAIDIPIFLGSLGPELQDKAELGRLGVRIGLQGHMPIMAGIQAVYNTLKALRAGSAPKDLDGVASADLMKQLTRSVDHVRMTNDHLASD